MSSVDTGFALGLKKGFPTTQRAKWVKPSNRKGALGKRVKLVRQVVREVAGFTPMEKRIMELLRIGKDKRALKFAKKRLGTHRRGKAKREEMSTVLQAMRAAKK
mmetsp:Transcript_41820/g.107911  ORF Transcript_41820/g.107911 Transcript_41820/m.107911 type:complete len:104 (-) Transcript_41820:51-362(-)|eukprot:CAMPEP_0113879352 /NCGR_PEP_ID=MMETSP0780_2-20120614/7192_1 /TAXON_ID=652834 /ORGANISM="Palpitomonas bilix" /LENGTH=103 /DNA_ID=CAMNT_0000865927 /DNA_START=55 /DNA_END=366 /DNA_ORIENTATION=- /assembly_acc=CAM_ASM_000599